MVAGKPEQEVALAEGLPGQLPALPPPVGTLLDSLETGLADADLLGVPSADSDITGIAEGRRAPVGLALLPSAARDVLLPDNTSAADRRTRHLDVVRRLWRLLFSDQIEPTYA